MRQPFVSANRRVGRSWCTLTLSGAAAAARSSPFEGWFPLLEKSRDALLLVLRAIDRCDEERLEFQPGVQIQLQSPVNGPFRKGEAQRSTLLIDIRQRLRRRKSLFLRHSTVHQPDAIGLSGVDWFRREQQLQRPRVADETRQPLRAAGPGHRPDTGTGDGEAGALPCGPGAANISSA